MPIDRPFANQGSRMCPARTLAPEDFPFNALRQHRRQRQFDLAEVVQAGRFQAREHGEGAPDHGAGVQINDHPSIASLAACCRRDPQDSLRITTYTPRARISDEDVSTRKRCSGISLKRSA